MPPLNADERTTLESWLDFHRAAEAIAVGKTATEKALEPIMETIGALG